MDLHCARVKNGLKIATALMREESSESWSAQGSKEELVKTYQGFPDWLLKTLRCVRVTVAFGEQQFNTDFFQSRRIAGSLATTRSGPVGRLVCRR